MKALDASRAMSVNETKPFRVSFQDVVFALLVGFGAFALFGFAAHIRWQTLGIAKSDIDLVSPLPWVSHAS